MRVSSLECSIQLGVDIDRIEIVFPSGALLLKVNGPETHEPGSTGLGLLLEELPL